MTRDLGRRIARLERRQGTSAAPLRVIVCEPDESPHAAEARWEREHGDYPPRPGQLGMTVVCDSRPGLQNAPAPGC